MWWSKPHCAVLLPDRIELSRAAGRKGAQTRDAIALVPAGATPWWRTALSVLESSIAPGERWRVILGGDTVKWLVVPWSDALATPRELRAYLRARVRATYGDIADGWQIAHSAPRPGAPLLVSALASDLLSALHEGIGRARGRVVAVRPLYSMQFDAWRRRMHGASIWFLLAESGRLSVGRLINDRFIAMHGESTPLPWWQAAPALMQQMTLATSTPATGTVYCLHEGRITPGDVDLSAWGPRVDLDPVARFGTDARACPWAAAC